MNTIVRLVCGVSLALLPVAAQEGEPSRDPVRRSIDVGGVAREVHVYLPADAKDRPCPIVFVYHGYGGSGDRAAGRFGIHRLWPEAIVMYPSGLPLPAPGRPESDAQPGWQRAAGDQGDRDLALFDAMIAWAKEQAKVDEKRLYATGHSNGASHSYLLAASRPILAAIAPSSGGSVRLVESMKPIPVLHFAGERDDMARIDGQRATMNAVRKLNQCEETGTEWAPMTTLYASKVGAPFAAHIHPGGHEIVPAAPELMVRFFKEHARP